MCDWRTFTAESNLVRESEAILYSNEQRNNCLDHLKWCSHLPDPPVVPDFLESFLASFLNCDLLILFFFIQLYSKHVVDSSFDMQSFLSMSNEIYGRNDVYTSQLVVLAVVVNRSNTKQPTTPSSLRARRLSSTTSSPSWSVSITSSNQRIMSKKSFALRSMGITTFLSPVCVSRRTRWTPSLS